MGKGRGYLVPENIEPIEDQCIVVFVPKDEKYIGQFWQAYEWFTYWLAWLRDPLHKGRRAANRWRSAYQKARAQWLSTGGCGMAITNIRQNPLNPCDVQVSEDNGITWSSVIDLKKCAGDCAGKLGEVLRDAGGQIQQYDPCEGKWVSAGPIVNPATDFNVTPAYVGDPAGACLAAANAAAYLNHNAGTTLSALASINSFANLLTNIEMALFAFTGIGVSVEPLFGLAAEIGSATMTALNDGAAYDASAAVTDIMVAYFDADGRMPDSAMPMLVHDLIAYKDTFASGTGERLKIGLIEVMAEILGPVGLTKLNKAANITTYDCSAASWVEVFDFTTGQHGWSRYDFAVYTPGIGWKTQVKPGSGINQRVLNVQIAMPTAYITSMEGIFHFTGGNILVGPNDHGAAALVILPSLATKDPKDGLADGDHDEIHAFNDNAGAIGYSIITGQIDTGVGSDPGGEAILSKLIVRGTGTNPFI